MGKGHHWGESSIVARMRHNFHEIIILEKAKYLDVMLLL
jgi:hypothetical protein